MAGEADVVAVKARQTGPRIYSFDVTVRHGDTGWKHYAGCWDAVGQNGKVFGECVFFHSHKNEQPFTRSLTGVKYPAM